MDRLLIFIIIHEVIPSAAIVFTAVIATSLDLEHLVSPWSLLLKVGVILIIITLIWVRVVSLALFIMHSCCRCRTLP